jgi:hypothetical protein
MRAWNMTIVSLLVAVGSAAAGLLGSAPMAAAADFCLADSFTNVAVGKAFSLPAKGVCNEFRGFFPGSEVFLFGQACGSSDNKRIVFRLTSMGPSELAGYMFTLDRGSLSGSGQFCLADVLGGGGECFEMTSIAKIPCTPSIVPLP